ncbi:CRISPR-associated endonuclease/helicase Cas3 [Candidatus Magnetomoraceae bacterium gMMP-1]
MHKQNMKSTGMKFDSDQILAKSDSTNLLQHIEECLKIYKELSLALPVIPCVADLENFFDLLFCSVYMHDWGKAHFEFQKVLNKKKNTWRRNRHEFFSVPFIKMLPFPPNQNELIELAIIGHHKDFETLEDYNYTESEIETYRISCKAEINPIDFKENLLHNLNINYLKGLKTKLEDYYEEYTNKKYKFVFKKIDFPSYKNPVKTIVKTYIAESSVDTKKYWQRMLMLGATRICDHLGSAGITEIPRLPIDRFAFLNDFKDTLYAHQEKCSHVKGNLFLVAPTGSGKTEAAFLWLKNQLKTGHQGRIFYILPYTASINAMHKRLIKDFEDKGTKPGQSKYIGIMHGKISQYLSEYLENTGDNPQEVQSRLTKIKDMHKQMIHPLKILTPFQILKYCYGVKGFEKGLTELAGAMLIFDEIHAYDEQTFAQIVSSLKWMITHLKVRVMIMTATLPTFMLDELQNTVGSYQVIKADASLLEDFTRHKVQILDGDIFDQLSEIRESLDNGKRVIVVCNTVSNAQKIFSKLNLDEEESVLLHSRFIAEDRLKKESMLFDKDYNIRLLVGTQAIEVSLDIDFDIMFTEPAPLDALIQRFGRINRNRKKGICPVYVCSKGGEHDHYIYPTEIVKHTLYILSKVSEIKEKKLQEMLDEVYPDFLLRDKYDEIKTGFTESLSRLKPFMRHKEQEEDFYKKFTGISVLPAEFQEDYETYLREFEFIKAEKLLITININMFYRLRAQQLMKKDEVVIEPKGRLKKIPYWFLKCQYSSQIGLLEKETQEIETKSTDSF